MEKDKEKSLADSIESLTKMVDGLRSRRYLQMVDKPAKFLFYNFISGVAGGLGTAFGATIIFALIVWLLSKMQPLPFLGEWVAKMLDYIQQVRMR
jgi:hypothetical protein